MLAPESRKDISNALQIPSSNSILLVGKKIDTSLSKSNLARYIAKALESCISFGPIIHLWKANLRKSSKIHKRLSNQTHSEPHITLKIWMQPGFLIIAECFLLLPCWNIIWPLKIIYEEHITRWNTWKIYKNVCIKDDLNYIKSMHKNKVFNFTWGNANKNYSKIPFHTIRSAEFKVWQYQVLVRLQNKGKWYHKLSVSNKIKEFPLGYISKRNFLHVQKETTTEKFTV